MFYRKSFTISYFLEKEISQSQVKNSALVDHTLVVTCSYAWCDWRRTCSNTLPRPILLLRSSTTSQTSHALFLRFKYDSQNFGSYIGCNLVISLVWLKPYWSVQECKHRQFCLRHPRACLWKKNVKKIHFSLFYTLWYIEKKVGRSKHTFHPLYIGRSNDCMRKSLRC